MDTEAPSTIDINYLKSSDFREVACDGVVGGPTPNDMLWLAFYSERFPLPRIVRHAVKPTGGKDQFELDPSVAPQHLDGRSGIIRNVEFGVYLDVDTAKHLREWLDTHIKTLEGKL